MFRLPKKIVLLLLLSAGLGHSQQQSNAPWPRFDVGPDSIEPCAVDGKCDDTVCDEKYMNRTGTPFPGGRGVGFHSYALNLTGPEDPKFGVQYYVCACNFKSATYGGRTLSSVEADSVCKINEYKLQLPEDSAVTCPEKGADNCVVYCNDVTFEDWKEANTFPEGGGGFGPVSASADNSSGCTCGWADERIEGCTLPVENPVKPPKPPDTVSVAKPLAAIGLALVTIAAAVGVEVVTFL